MSNRKHPAVEQDSTCWVLFYSGGFLIEDDFLSAEKGNKKLVFLLVF